VRFKGIRKTQQEVKGTDELSSGGQSPTRARGAEELVRKEVSAMIWDEWWVFEAQLL
jgi:hypothetical protein